jgi:hypothetical protein
MGSFRRCFGGLNYFKSICKSSFEMRALWSPLGGLIKAMNESYSKSSFNSNRKNDDLKLICGKASGISQQSNQDDKR